MKYIVNYIPTGVYFIDTGRTKSSDEKYCLFSKLGLLKPVTEDKILRFRANRSKEALLGNKRALKYEHYTDSQIEKMFERTPMKFISYDDTKQALLNADFFIGINKELRQRPLAESELILFDIIEVDDD